jgi:hypothetical protein
MRCGRARARSAASTRSPVGAEAIQQRVAGVAQARDEPQVEQGEHDLGGAVGVGRVLEDR